MRNSRGGDGAHSWVGLDTKGGLFSRNYALLSYPMESFDFASVVSASIGEPDLQLLGISAQISLRSRKTDQKTPWHRTFYDTFASWRPLYENFISEVIGRLFDDKFYYQAIPSFRVHLPDNLAVGEFHTDRDYGHPEGEITFWVPLTPAFETNSVWIESAPGRGDYSPINADPGTMLVFDAGHLHHGNMRNSTGRTRVSFDFRCLPVREYKETEHRSINAGLAFAPGGYYGARALEPTR